MAKDFLHQELSVDDQVVLFSIYRKIFLKGRITKIHKNLIYIETNAKVNNQLKRDCRSVIKLS